MAGLSVEVVVNDGEVTVEPRCRNTQPSNGKY